MAYQYKSLQQHQFRLLTIEAADSLDAPVDLSLTVHDLGRGCLQWDAISYFWGASKASHQVYVDEKILHINENAYSALVHCRHSKHARVIWVDQICINQEDQQERYQQVAIMGNIFQNAQSVVIYLCDAWPGLELFFKFLNVIEHSPSFWSIEWWLSQSSMPKDSPLRYLLDPSIKFSLRVWAKLEEFHTEVDTIIEAHNRLLQVDWFQRTWVVQEASLAQRLIVQCSHLQATWQSLAVANGRFYYAERSENLYPMRTIEGFRSDNAIRLLRSYKPGHRQSLRYIWSRSVNSLRAKGIWHFWTTMKSAMSRLRQAWYPDVLAVLRHFRWQRSTDERDKVFGLLGLVDPRLTHRLIRQRNDFPGTFDTVSGVMFQFAMLHIAETKTLDILMGGCYRTKAHADLPYWVPDWSQTGPICETEYCFPLKTPPHQAGTQYPAKPAIIKEDRALIVRGILWDIVEEVSSECIELDQSSDPSDPVWASWRSFATKSYIGDDDPYGNAAGRSEAFWRVLIYDTDGAGDRVTSEFGHDFDRWFKGTVPPRTSEAASITGRIIWKSRKLFRTHRGYLGNGCAEIRMGDKVCVLQGARLPVVLRYERDVSGSYTENHPSHDEDAQPLYRHLKGYYLIGGDAYVHGICEGQVWDIAKKNGIATQEFALI